MNWYFINLDRDADRRAWIERQAAAVGVTLIRVPAVLGSALDVETLVRHRGDGAGGAAQDGSDRKDLSSGEIGCLLSHASALRLFVETGDPYAMIVEDDVHIATDAPAVLDELATVHLPDFDFIKLEATPMRTFVSRAYRPVQGRRLHDLLSFNLGTAAYLVKRSTALRLIEQFETSKVPCDYALCSPAVNGFHIGQLDPSPFIQDGFKGGGASLGSSIGERPSHRRRKRRFTGLKALANRVYNVLQIPMGRQRIKVGFR